MREIFHCFRISNILNLNLIEILDFNLAELHYTHGHLAKIKVFTLMKTMKVHFPNAICSVKSINSPGSLALVQGLGESGDSAETEPRDNHQQLHAVSNTGAPSSGSGQMARKVYVCINDLSLERNPEFLPASLYFRI